MFVVDVMRELSFIFFFFDFLFEGENGIEESKLLLVTNSIQVRNETPEKKRKCEIDVHSFVVSVMDFHNLLHVVQNPVEIFGDLCINCR